MLGIRRINLRPLRGDSALGRSHGGGDIADPRSGDGGDIRAPQHNDIRSARIPMGHKRTGSIAAFQRSDDRDQRSDYGDGASGTHRHATLPAFRQPAS